MYRAEAFRMGQQKLREASQWWDAWNASIHKYRCWAMLFVSRQWALHTIDQAIGRSEVVAHATKLINARNAAHDFMLVAIESARSQEACARSCEFMAQVYFEQAEGRMGGGEDGG